MLENIVFIIKGKCSQKCLKMLRDTKEKSWNSILGTNVKIFKYAINCTDPALFTEESFRLLNIFCSIRDTKSNHAVCVLFSVRNTSRYTYSIKFSGSQTTVLQLLQGAIRTEKSLRKKVEGKIYRLYLVQLQ